MMSCITYLLLWDNGKGREEVTETYLERCERIIIKRLVSHVTISQGDFPPPLQLITK